MKKRIFLTIIALNMLVASLAGCFQIDNKKDKDKEDDERKDSGIVLEKDNYNNSNNVIVNPENSEEIIIDNDWSSELSAADYQVLEQVIEGDFSLASGEIGDIKVEYPYSELYSGEYEISVSKSNKVNENIIQNNMVLYDRLYQRVLVNNAVYMEENNINNYKDTTDSLVAKVCKLITDEVNDLLANNEIIDTVSLNEKLNDLKIFSYVSFSYGLYNQRTGVLAVNESTLNSKGEDIMRDVIGHEIVHMAQSASASELENASYLERFGYCYKKDTEGFNPYNWTWFIESCAEEHSYKFNGLDEPFVYPSEIKTIEAMKLATFMVGDELTGSLYSSDINELYKLFGAQTAEEKNEIQKMFYAFTIAYNDIPGQEGNNLFQIIYPKVGNDYNRIQSEIKGSACLTLAKIFYQNLANKIGNNIVKIEDVFKVISIYELEMSRELWYQSKNDKIEIFMNGYVAIQDVFFQSLADKLKADLMDVKELYYAYNANVEITNVDIPWLSAKENAYLEYINASRIGNKKEAIFKVYEDNLTNAVNR